MYISEGHCRLTGLGSTCAKASLYASCIAAKSSMVVRKTLTLTTLARLDPDALRTAERCLRVWRCDRLIVLC